LIDEVDVREVLRLLWKLDLQDDIAWSYSSLAENDWNLFIACLQEAQ